MLKNWFLVGWSAVQVILGLYSIGLLFGSIPFKVVLLYVNLGVKILVALFLSIAVIWLAQSLVIFLASQDETTQKNALWGLLYQLGLTVPSLLFMAPFWFYLEELALYIKKYYPALANFTAQVLAQKMINGDIDQNGKIIKNQITLQQTYQTKKMLATDTNNNQSQLKIIFI
ncbi:UNKNOWN [Stylonychia lemnae]|uniref:Transmembrane protein n=1 Tax=Stylonychia lemnae TaxID=5949 RepID=A0A078B930_STYLE|nr:UNKNOWN [Stylonychia lemnae]|eukprot:CDW90068.1 UNKNOWN [Stylonychia lemnae]